MKAFKAEKKKKMEKGIYKVLCFSSKCKSHVKNHVINSMRKPTLLHYIFCPMKIQKVPINIYEYEQQVY